MTSFVHLDYSTEHPGVVRAERAAHSLKRIASRAGNGPTLLLAAIVSALLVVANQVVDTWTEGHLLAAWIVLWTIAFAALGLLAAPARRTVRSAQSGWLRFGAARRQAAEDRQLWNVALTDARVMAEISHAMTRDAMRDVRSYD